MSIDSFFFSFLTNFFSVDNTFIELGGYAVSYIELLGTSTGILAVWLSARANGWGWLIGLLNVTLFFFLFFQVQLYPDMALQVFFFVTNIIGWWRWKYPRVEEQNSKKELKVSRINRGGLMGLMLLGSIATTVLGSVASHLHTWLPYLFSRPSSFPYLDSFVATMSIVGTFLMVQKKIECWVIWIIVDILATGIYFAKDIKVVAAEYLLFTLIAVFGLWNWINQYNNKL